MDLKKIIVNATVISSFNAITDELLISLSEQLNEALHDTGSTFNIRRITVSGKGSVSITIDIIIPDNSIDTLNNRLKDCGFRNISLSE